MDMKAPWFCCGRGQTAERSVSDSSVTSSGPNSGRARSFHVHQSHLVGKAVGQHRISLARHIHVAHDIAAAGNHPALEFFGCRIKANNGVGFGTGLVVPDGTLGEDDAVGLRLGPARRWPFGSLAGTRVK